MVKATIVYSGDLRCVATHEPSHAQITTDAPVDNHGKGESFSPTDLVATALGTCMATIMGIYARQKNVDLSGMRVEVTKEMSTNGLRRIARLASEIWLPAGSAASSHMDTAEARMALERAALTCPVHQSLSVEIDRPVTFHWPDKVASS